MSSKAVDKAGRSRGSPNTEPSRQLTLADNKVIQIPAGFGLICDQLRLRPSGMAMAEAALVNSAVRDLDHASAESTKAFLDRMLDGTVSDADLIGFWESAATGLTFADGNDLRWFMGLLRVGIADVLS